MPENDEKLKHVADNPILTCGTLRNPAYPGDSWLLPLHFSVVFCDRFLVLISLVFPHVGCQEDSKFQNNVLDNTHICPIFGANSEAAVSSNNR